MLHPNETIQLPYANSQGDWLRVAELVGTQLQNRGFYGCYLAKSADEADFHLFPNIRNDMLSCGYYDPYYILARKVVTVTPFAPYRTSSLPPIEKC